MTDLILYLGVTVIGYFFGSKLRNKKDRLTWTGKVQTVAIMLLVLCMGARMGSNKEIIDNLGSIGFSAFLITVVIMVFSVAAIWITRKFLGIDRFGRLEKSRTPSSEAGMTDDEENKLLQEVHEKEDEAGDGNRMTLIILLFVTAGMLIGYFVIRNVFADNMQVFENAAGLGIKIGLCLLLVFIGIDLGIEGTVADNFKAVGLRIFAIPLAIIVGTLSAAFIMSFFLDLTVREALAIGAGFGWYTLAPGIIMEAGHMTASAVCFLHNVMRELFAILLIPLVAKKIGYVETVGMPGSAAMDVCLPIVEKATRSDIAVYSFISGAILSILVPILVPLIIG
ncbi:MAG: hypothetical protein DBY08_00930 [Clostridiales bacterium]|nr:MAG: hypothetical protein DBY08_00930 [Clostridiales bacterium]